jgi:predicted Zn-ribbon and HTH transcriptional regulator
MTEVKCEHCGYEWEYSGDMKFATCPSCRTKTPVEDEPVEAQ